jgi:hypothetical protein
LCPGSEKGAPFPSTGALPAHLLCSPLGGPFVDANFPLDHWCVRPGNGRVVETAAIMRASALSCHRQHLSHPGPSCPPPASAPPASALRCSFDSTLGYPAEGPPSKFMLRVCSFNPNSWAPKARRQAAQLKYRLLHSAAMGTSKASKGGVAVFCSIGATCCVRFEIVPSRSIAVAVRTATFGEAAFVSFLRTLV